MFLQSPMGLITQSATEGKRSLMIKEDGDYFFSFNQLPAFRLEYLNVIYWNALIASIILLCLLYFSSSSFSFEQQNKWKENTKKNVGVGRFFSMHAKVNELVLNETKEETMLKIAQKFMKKGKKKP